MTEYAKLVISVDSSNIRQTDTDLGKLKVTAGAVEKTAGSLGKTLAQLAGPIAAFLSVRAIVTASDRYGQMAARIRMATSSTEEYIKVQGRLLANANATYRSLSEAQEVYIRTADAIRALGYTTDDALDITDSFSSLLVTNAASAERGASAINAYSKAIQTGRLDSQSWQTILTAMPTVVDDLARTTNRSATEIRKLGIEGKLSVEALNEALRRTVTQNAALVEGMETSVQDATTALSNSFEVFIGKVNESSGASGLMTTAIEDLAKVLQDPETIRAAQEMAGGVVTALTAIMTAATTTANVVRWAADEIAASLHGAALDDIVRVEDEIAELTTKIDRFNQSADNMPALGKWLDDVTGISASSDARLQKWTDRLAMLTQARDDFYKSKAPKEIPILVDEKPKTTTPVDAEAPSSKTARRARITDAERLVKKQAEYLAQLEREVDLLGKSAAEARTYEMLEQGLTGAMRERADTLLEIVQANEQQEAYKQLLTEMQTGEEALTAQMKERLAVLERTQGITEEERNKARDRIENGATNAEAKRIIEQLRTQEEQIEESYARRRESILKSTEITGAEQTQALERIEKERAESLLAISDDYWARYLDATEKALQNFDALAGNVIENFSTNFGSAFESMIFDTKSLEETMLGLAESMSRTVINALGQMAAQWLAYQAVQMLTGKTTQASAASTLAANASAQSVMAGLNAFTSTAAIPIVGPLAAPAAAAAATAVTAPMAAAVSALALSGMAHQGIDYIPKEGTWLLDRGERVVDSRTNEDLKRYLRDKPEANQPMGQRPSLSFTQNISVPERMNARTSNQVAGDAARSQRLAAARLGK